VAAGFANVEVFMQLWDLKLQVQLQQKQNSDL